MPALDISVGTEVLASVQNSAFDNGDICIVDACSTFNKIATSVRSKAYFVNSHSFTVKDLNIKNSNRMFGGYKDTAWDMKIRHAVKTGNFEQAILVEVQGPLFGLYDIYIADKCSASCANCSKDNESYTLPPEADPDTYFADSCKITVTEIEVYNEIATALCEVCDVEEVSSYCKECTSPQFYCSKCFDLSHKSDRKKCMPKCLPQIKRL